MDNFILIQNYVTLENLTQCLAQTSKISDPYVYLNELLRSFMNFVTENKNLWFLLYDFHMKESQRTYSYLYLRKIVEIGNYVKQSLEQIVPLMEKPERVLSARVLWLCLFAVSAFAANNSLKGFSKVEENSICQILLNTYVAGLTVLERK